MCGIYNSFYIIIFLKNNKKATHKIFKKSKDFLPITNKNNYQVHANTIAKLLLKEYDISFHNITYVSVLYQYKVIAKPRK